MNFQQFKQHAMAMIEEEFPGYTVQDEGQTLLLSSEDGSWSVQVGIDGIWSRAKRTGDPLRALEQTLTSLQDSWGPRAQDLV